MAFIKLTWNGIPAFINSEHIVAIFRKGAGSEIVFTKPLFGKEGTDRRCVDEPPEIVTMKIREAERR